MVGEEREWRAVCARGDRLGAPSRKVWGAVALNWLALCPSLPSRTTPSTPGVVLVASSEKRWMREADAPKPLPSPQQQHPVVESDLQLLLGRKQRGRGGDERWLRLLSCLLFVISVPVVTTWLSFQAGCSAFAMTVALVLTSVGIIGYLFAPIEMITPAQKDDDRSSDSEQGCSQATLALAVLVQTGMGAAALVQLHILKTELPTMPSAAGLILSVCTLIPLFDALGWLLADVFRVAWMAHATSWLTATKLSVENSSSQAAVGVLETGRAGCLVCFRQVHLHADEPVRNKRACTRWAIQRVDGIGKWARASPAKAVAIALNIVVIVNALHPQDLAVLLETIGIPIPNIDPLTGWIAISARSLWRLATGQGSELWAANAFYLDDHLPSTTAPTSCDANAPCQMIGRPSGCGSEMQHVWLPRHAPSAVVEVVYEKPLLAREIAIHYQLRAVAKTSTANASAVRRNDGSRWLRNASFTIRLQALDQRFDVHVSSDHAGQRKASVRVLNSTTFAATGFALIGMGTGARTSTRAASSIRAMVTSAFGRCPGPLRFAWTKSTPVPQIQRIFVSLQASRGARVGINGIHLEVEQDRRRKETCSGLDVQTGSRNDTEEAAEAVAADGETRRTDTRGDSDDEEKTTDGEQGEEEMHSKGLNRTQSEGVAGASGAWGDHDTEDVLPDEDAGCGQGHSNAWSMGGIANAITAATTVATAASTTEFVRKRTRPGEYRASKEREKATMTVKLRRAEVENKLRRSVAPTFDVGEARLAVVEAKEWQVAHPLVRAVESRIQASLTDQERMRIGQRLEDAVRTALRSKGLPKTGQAAVADVGVSKRLLDDVEYELFMAIHDARAWGLNQDAIRLGEKVLADLKKAAARSRHDGAPSDRSSPSCANSCDTSAATRSLSV